MMDKTPSSRRIVSPRALILGVTIAAMLFSSVYPLGRYVAVRNDVASLERDERRLSEQIAELMERKELLDTPAEIERLAREQLGYVRPGEVPFVIVPKADRRRARDRRG